ncbi:MAG: type III polyketide synthase [Gemmatimonadales bacterium]|nr:MAG: type III polyketide synthase [Gemmatimonadales bacterium]
MPVYLHALETSVPDSSYSQEWACELMQRHCSERKGVRRIIRSIYRNSGIETRHSVIDDFDEDAQSPLFFADPETLLPTPGTHTRNEVYTREAKRHFEALARGLVEKTPGVQPSDVTHVITVSCTGFFAPGPDYHVVRALGLSGSTQRYHLGFMGCYAAFQGLRMAEAFCRNDPRAVVLVLCVELCTLHLRFTENTDDLIAGAVFADGGAGALVSARAPDASAHASAQASAQASDHASDHASAHAPDHAPARGRVLEFGSFHTDLTEEGEEDMAWTIGDDGFRMKLSTYVPQIIESNLEPVVGALLERAGVRADEIPWWGIHPGGRAILDRVEESMALRPEALEASREVLRRYGNMSSATVLFVLKQILESGDLQRDDPVLAMAFGPGLTIETGLFRVR